MIDAAPSGKKSPGFFESIGRVCFNLFGGGGSAAVIETDRPAPRPPERRQAPQTEQVKFVELSKPTARNNFLEKLDFIVEILKTAETNEVDENKKKEIQDAILVVEERRNLRKNLRESLRGSVI